MHACSAVLPALIVSLSACDNPVSKPGPLSFLSDAPPPDDPPLIQFRIGGEVSGEADDGFGSAIAADADEAWIGAPHGPIGRIYRWDRSSINLALEHSGRAGAHLTTTSSGLWVGAPLVNSGAGAVLDIDGTVQAADYDGTGIALSGAGGGTYGHATGWVAKDGRAGTTAGRPAALAEANGVIGAGMPLGEIALSWASQQIRRPTVGDELGFALAVADVDGDGFEDWITGSPGTNTVVAYSYSNASRLREWSGRGRFGSSIVVCDLNKNGTPDLVVGSPVDGDNGTITWFPDLSPVEAELIVDWPSGIQLLGAALACVPDGLLVGAPGDAAEHGRVIWIESMTQAQQGRATDR